VRLVDIKDAAAILQGGGLIIYQTETFCAIGALADNAEANAEICAIKRRPQNKPLPVVAADTTQAARVADISATPRSLPFRFWPGPLSLVLPAKGRLAPELLNSGNEICVRVTSFSPAASLAAQAGMPLSASSANLSGQAPPAALSELSCDFLDACRSSRLYAAILSVERTESAARTPSTIVRPVRTGCRWHLEILREGAVPACDLNKMGLTLT